MADDDRSAKPPLPKLGSFRSAPATPSRRTRGRIAVGFTNRPNSVSSSHSSAQNSQRSCVSAQGERDGTFPLFQGTMASKDPQDVDLRGKVREKILKRRVNVVPLLKQNATNGYVSSTDMRDALRKMHIGLNEDEAAFCSGSRVGQPDDFVDVRAFVDSLTVPDYEGYDPMGKSKARESKALKRLAFPPRNKPDRWTANEKADDEPLDDDGEEVKPESRRSTAVSSGSAPGDELRPIVLLNKRQARRHVKTLARKLKERGLSVLDIFREIDKDASGVIEKSEFEAVLKKRTDLGVLQQQVDDVWALIDKDGNNSINYLELEGALNEEANSSKGSRPGTKSRPGSTMSAESNHQGPSFADPWAQRKGVRTPFLPSDHFNVRSWRGDPPRSTEDLVVPREESFLHCPEWLQYSTVSLNNNWLTECTGQGQIQKTRAAARLERKRESWASVDALVAERESKAQERDAARLSGLCKTRLQWMAMLKGPWA